ncbi:MAG: tetratricopeptide repeat protein [Armatimonadetes bacterium]|nr:tetratricopeptide repeat protein [Armatimonadota bacterium]
MPDNGTLGINRARLTSETTRLEKALAVIGVLIIAALVYGVVTGAYETFVFLISLVLLVGISWLWSVAVDRMFHRLRDWNRSQKPKPVADDSARKEAAVRIVQLRPVTDGPASLSLASLIRSGHLPLVSVSTESADPAERIEALKLEAAEALKALAKEMENAGRGEAKAVYAAARQYDPFDPELEEKAPSQVQEIGPDELSRVLALLRRSDVDEALPALEELSNSSSSGALLYSLALCNGAAGRHGRAAEMLLKAAEQGAESAELREALGILYLQGADTDRAIKQLRASVAMDDALAGSHAALGAAFLETGNTQEARQELEEALSLDPDFSPARMALGRLLYEKRDFAGASREFARVVTSDPDNVNLLFNTAAAEVAAGRYSEAIARLSPIADEVQDSQIVQLLAEAHEKSGNKVLSQRYYARSAELTPASAAQSPRLKLAASFREEGRLDEARLEAEAAVQDNPRSAEALTELGLVQEAQGDADAALNTFRSAYQIDRSSAVAGTQLGRFMVEAGRLKDAAGYLKSAAASSGASADTHYWLGEMHLRSGKPLLAINALREAARLASRPRGDISSALGKALLDAGRAQDASEELRRARKLSDQPEVLRDLGYAYHRTRNYQDAVRSLRDYLQERPDAADAAEVRELIQKLS